MRQKDTTESLDKRIEIQKKRKRLVELKKEAFLEELELEQYDPLFYPDISMKYHKEKIEQLRQLRNNIV